VFAFVASLTVAISFTSYFDLIRTAQSEGELYFQFIAFRLGWAAIAAWLVHRSVTKVTAAQGKARLPLAHSFACLTFLIPEIGLPLFANWRYEVCVPSTEGRDEKSPEANSPLPSPSSTTSHIPMLKLRPFPLFLGLTANFGNRIRR